MVSIKICNINCAFAHAPPIIHMMEERRKEYHIEDGSGVSGGLVENQIMFWVSLMPLNVDFLSEGFSM